MSEFVINEIKWIPGVVTQKCDASFDPTYLWKKGDRREASGADVPAP